MKKNIASRKCPRLQRGFSILEILIATVLISSLVASGIYYADLGSKSSVVNIAAIKAVTAVRFPEALVAIYSNEQSFEDIDKDDLIETGSVQSDVPVEWDVAGGDDAPTKNSLKLSLTFDDNKEAAVLKSYLTTNKDSLMVSAAEINADNDKVLLITYGIN